MLETKWLNDGESVFAVQVIRIAADKVRWIGFDGETGESEPERLSDTSEEAVEEMECQRAAWGFE